MDVQMLATIIQGEAGTLGPMGMIAIAMSLSCRIWQHGHDMARVEKEYYGRAEPGPIALLLANLIAENRLPICDFYYAMGQECDVIPNNWEEGDVVVRVGKDAVHLYKSWPKEKGGEQP